MNITKYDTEKFCPKCEQVLPLAQFYFYEKLLRYESWCKECKNREQRERHRARYTAEIGRKRNLRDHYKGFSHEQYEEMLAAQGGVCAVCGRPETVINARTKKVQNLHVDHDHITGRVRALLCQECNTAYGMLKEDPERIRLLLTYAEKHKA